MSTTNGLTGELRRLYVDGWRMRGQLGTGPTHHRNSIRDSAEFRAIVADIEADLLQQEREFDATSL